MLARCSLLSLHAPDESREGGNLLGEINIGPSWRPMMPRLLAPSAGLQARGGKEQSA